MPSNTYLKLRIALINNELFGENNVRSAWASSYFGKLYVKLGNVLQAKSLFKKTLIVYEKEYGKNHVETARVWRVLGEAYLAEGQLDMAEEYFLKALEIVQARGNSDSYMSLEDLARLHLKKSKFAEIEGDTKNLKIM
jgi:tetratricopeptide (TPR) repeat protein